MDDPKLVTGWYSERLQRELSIARWGVMGVPIIIFPTAGGDAEEIERFKVIHVLEPLLSEGRIKVYSCDSINGRALLTQEGSPEHRGWVMDQFLEFIRWEMVPAIRLDCRDPDISVMAGGPSIGAYNALAALCRYPDVFTHAICLSGTFDLTRWVDNRITEQFYRASPLHFVPKMDGDLLETLRTRFVILASGEGRWENIGESWTIANVLGARGIPNRVDPWGNEWDHDWQTWRAMLPHYLGELAP